MESNPKLRQAFGKVLLELREIKAVSQQDLADECDLERAYISRLERGLFQPSLTVIFRLSEAFNITPATFMEKVSTVYKKKGIGKK